MNKGVKDVYENLDKKAKTDFLKTRLSSLRGILAHHKQIALDTSSEMEDLQLEIDKMNFNGKGCNLSYYEIRSGKCQYAQTYPPNGDIFCVNPNCKNYRK